MFIKNISPKQTQRWKRSMFVLITTVLVKESLSSDMSGASASWVTWRLLILMPYIDSSICFGLLDIIFIFFWLILEIFTRSVHFLYSHQFLIFYIAVRKKTVEILRLFFLFFSLDPWPDSGFLERSSFHIKKSYPDF
jgi:hypothetical protein